MRSADFAVGAGDQRSLSSGTNEKVFRNCSVPPIALRLHRSTNPSIGYLSNFYVRAGPVPALSGIVGDAITSVLDARPGPLFQRGQPQGLSLQMYSRPEKTRSSVHCGAGFLVSAGRVRSTGVLRE